MNEERTNLFFRVWFTVACHRYYLPILFHHSVKSDHPDTVLIFAQANGGIDRIS